MFLGFYLSAVTRKNQITFPNRLKQQTGGKLLITKWFENSLVILPQETGKQILDKVLLDSSALLPEQRDLERFFYGNAYVTELDMKNRFVLPMSLKNHAKISKRAIYIGVSDRIELWDEEMYANYGSMKELQIREAAIQHYNRIKK